MNHTINAFGKNEVQAMGEGDVLADVEYQGKNARIQLTQVMHVRGLPVLPFISLLLLLFPFLLPPCLFSFSIISYIAVSILFPVAGLIMSLSSSYIVSH